MPAYDHYEQAREVASQLAAEGWKSEAEQIIGAIRDGMSGTEIFMHLRYLLTPFLYVPTLPTDLKEKIEVLHRKLDEALR